MHPIGLLFVAILLAFVAITVAAFWWAFLTAGACLLAWRMYLRHREREAQRGSIPYPGRLGLIEWLACKLIGMGERILREHNRKRPTRGDDDD